MTRQPLLSTVSVLPSVVPPIPADTSPPSPRRPPLVNGSASRPLSGRYLAHAELSAVKRAFLAADLALGRAHLVRPTLGLCALAARVSVPYAAAARRVAYERPDLRSAVECGLLP